MLQPSRDFIAVGILLEHWGPWRTLPRGLNGVFPDSILARLDLSLGSSRYRGTGCLPRATITRMLLRRVVPSRCTPAHENDQLDLNSIAENLAELAGSNPADLIHEVDQDRRTAVILLGTPTRNLPLRLQILALRGDDDRPIQFRPGLPLSSIEVEPGAYAGDVTHVSIWPDGIAAQDWYTDVPRLSRLAEYLRLKFNIRLVFKPIYQSDLLDAIADIHGQMRRVSISINNDQKSIPDTGVFGALVPELFGTKAPSVKVDLGIGRYGPRNRYLDEDVEQAVLTVAQNAEDLLDNLILTGRSHSTGRMRVINLLKERLGMEVGIEPNSLDASLPDEDATFAAIEGAVATWRSDDSLNIVAEQDMSE